MKRKWLYRDFLTKKIRWTWGKPTRICRDGPLAALGLEFQNEMSIIWIPEYLLVGDSRDLFNKMKEGGE